MCGPQLEAGLASPDAFRETAGRYAEVGATDLVVHWPRAEAPYAADPAVFERIFARLPDLEITGPPDRLQSNFIHGIKRMPCAFTPGRPIGD